MEAAILRKMEESILQLGVGCAFVGRRKRIMVDSLKYFAYFYSVVLRAIIFVAVLLDGVRREPTGCRLRSQV